MWIACELKGRVVGASTDTVYSCVMEKRAPEGPVDISVELEHAIGFAGAVYDGQHYHPNGRDFVYAAGATVGEGDFPTSPHFLTLTVCNYHFAVICDFTDPHNQHFLRGHNDNVTCVALSRSVSE